MSLASLLLFGLCLLVSFLYSGIEAGLLSLSRARLRSRIHRGERGAVRLGRLLAHPGRLLATVLLVTNFADVAALVLITDACVKWFGPRHGYGIAGVAMLPVYLLGVQLLPKSLFRRFPYRATAALAGLLEVTSRLLWPLLAAGRFLVRRSLPSVPVMNAGSRGLASARQDFKSLAAEGERTGALTAAEYRLINGVLNFSALAVCDLQEPLPEGFRLPADPAAVVTVADLLASVREREADFLPVFSATGELFALLDVFALCLERDPGRPAKAYLRRAPVMFPSGEPAASALRRLRALRLGAAVVGEAGGTPTGLLRTSELLGRLTRQDLAEAVGQKKGRK